MNLINLNSLGFLKEVDIAGIVDIVFMSIIIYTILIWFKRSKATYVLTGILILGGIFLISKQFNLLMTAAILQKFFAVIFIVIVIIFQDELKRLFEQLAIWSLKDRNISKKKLLQLSRNEVQVLVRTLLDFSREKIGAIIVIKGQTPIARYIQGGVDLKGDLSEPLLKSIFDPHSAGHDGAVIIENNKIVKFSCHLPLSKNFHKLKYGGTRHAAGLGLSELSDALCIISSEEKGIISIARNGEIIEINDPEKLNLIIEKFYREILPIEKTRPIIDYFKKNSTEKIFAFLISIVLWFVLVHESRLVYKDFIIPVEQTELSEEFILQEVKPKEVTATFSAPRKVFYFLKKEDIRLVLKILNVNEGIKTITLDKSNLLYPQDISLIKIEPKYVTVSVLSKEQIKENQKEVENK